MGEGNSDSSHAEFHEALKATFSLYSAAKQRLLFDVNFALRHRQGTLVYSTFLVFVDIINACNSHPEVSIRDFKSSGAAATDTCLK